MTLSTEMFKCPSLLVVAIPTVGERKKCIGRPRREVVSRAGDTDQQGNAKSIQPVADSIDIYMSALISV